MPTRKRLQGSRPTVHAPAFLPSCIHPCLPACLHSFQCLSMHYQKNCLNQHLHNARRVSAWVWAHVWHPCRSSIIVPSSNLSSLSTCHQAEAAAQCQMECQAEAAHQVLGAVKKSARVAARMDHDHHEAAELLYLFRERKMQAAAAGSQ
jgi:hypothetical protein